jgi:hypothetical protein
MKQAVISQHVRDQMPLYRIYGTHLERVAVSRTRPLSSNLTSVKKCVIDRSELIGFDLCFNVEINHASLPLR